MSRSALAAALVAFLAVLAAYVALVLTDHDPSGLVPMVVTVLGVLGLGAHIEKRTQEQNATIAKIDRQTNGVLTQRIEEGTRKAVSDLLTEHNIIPAPDDPFRGSQADK